MKAPEGLEFRLPTPFNGFDCTAPLFTAGQSIAENRNGTFKAVFGSGADIPSATGELLVATGESKPFDHCLLAGGSDGGSI